MERETRASSRQTRDINKRRKLFALNNKKKIKWFQSKTFSIFFVFDLSIFFLSFLDQYWLHPLWCRILLLPVRSSISILETERIIKSTAQSTMLCTTMTTVPTSSTGWSSGWESDYWSYCSCSAGVCGIAFALYVEHFAVKTETKGECSPDSIRIIQRCLETLNRCKFCVK